MGLYVHVSVIFACDSNEGVASLAADYLTRLSFGDDSPVEAKWFLKELSERSGGNAGPKGGVSHWGIIGNYTEVDEFVDFLKPFWTALLGEVKGGPLSHERIIVLWEREQSEMANAYEIYLDNDSNLVIDSHECPFAFMQF